MAKSYTDILAEHVLSLTGAELEMEETISHRIISKLDKVSRLSAEDENLVHIVVGATLYERRQLKKS